MNAGLIAIGLAFGLGTIGCAQAATYRLGETIDCPVPPQANLVPGALHEPDPDVTLGPVPQFGIEDTINPRLRLELDEPAPEGTFVPLGTAEIDPRTGAVRLGGLDYGPSPIDCHYLAK